MALAALIGCYSLYAKYAVPVLEGPPNILPPRTFVAYEDLPPASAERDHLIPFLPANSWETGDCQTLLTSSGTILFKTFEEQKDGTLTVAPFTLFSGLETKFTDANLAEKKTDSPKMPTVLRCIQGANLRFDKPMSEVYGGKANLESARLIGNVDIYRPPTAPKAEDAVQILTSNVQIDKKRIYTIENVQFAFGRNRGSGRNLAIDLTHDNAPGNDFSNIEGVKRMELAFLHSLRIERNDSSNSFSSGTNQNSNSEPASRLFSNQKSPIEVSCQGPFVFDFDAQTASFQKEVKARLDDAYQDSIECDQLLLQFENKPLKLADGQPSLEPDGTANKPPSKLMGDLDLKTLVAQGMPAVLTSRSKSAKITSQYLSYTVATDLIAGRCDAESDLMMTVVSPEYQMVSKQLEYVVPKDKSLGPIKAYGPGRLLKLAKDDQKEFFATWKNSLTSTNVANQQSIKKITLDGDTHIRIGTDTKASADKLELLVWEVENANTAQLPLRSNQPTAKTNKWDYKPIKIICQGNVEIDSPKFTGSAKDLTATWPRLLQAANQNRTGHEVGYRGTLQIQSNDSEFETFVQQQSTTYPTSPRASPFRSNNANETSQSFEGPLTGRSPSTTQLKPLESTANSTAEKGFIELATFNQAIGQAVESKKPNKIKFRGDEVTVLLEGLGKETKIRDLTVIGNVYVTEIKQGDNKPKRDLLNLHGDRLRLLPQSEDSYRAVISRGDSSSNPASVFATDFELKGEHINLDQQANKVWVEGAGSMRLKTDGKTANANFGDGLDNTNLLPPGPQNLEVNWSGGMIFDGSKIYFERNVIMSSFQPDKNGKSMIKSLSEGLRIELDEPVDFKNLSKDKKIGKAKVRELFFASEIPESKQVFQFAGNKTPVGEQKGKFVVVENKKFDLTNKLVEKQNIVVPNATVNAKTGTIYAKGPGTISTHRESSQSDKPNALSNFSKAKKGGLSFIQINFDGELSIEQKEKRLIVNRNVRTIFAPVGSWNQTFNPDNSRRLAPAGSVNLTCQNLQLAQWKPRGQAAESEMIASGNIHLFSETLETTADRLSYKQSTDMLIIEGTPRNEANLWYKQSPTDKKPINLTAEKISYRIKDQWTHVDAVKGVNIGGTR